MVWTYAADHFDEYKLLLLFILYSLTPKPTQKAAALSKTAAFLYY